MSKRGSKSKLLKNTVDATTITYSASQAGSRDPGTLFTDVWRWNGAVQYGLTGLRPRTLTPLWFLRDLPVIGGIGGLKFNYVPASVRTDATGSRDFSASRARSPLIRRLDEPDQRPDLIRFPIREQHNFAHARTFSLTYSPFSFVDTQFDTRVDQNLGLVGLDTLFSLVRADGATGGSSTTRISRDEAFQIDRDTLSSTFVERRLRTVPLASTVSRVLAGDPRFRTNTYGQNLTVALRPRLPQALNFVRADNIAFNVQYSWVNAPLNQFTGAGVGTSVNTGATISILPQTLWRKFSFYRSLEAEQTSADQARTTRETKAEADRRARADRRRAEAAQRRAAAAAARIADSTAAANPGVPSPGVPPETESAPAGTGQTTGVPVGERPLGTDPVAVGEGIPPGERLPEDGTPDGLAPGAAPAVVVDSTPAKRGFRLPLPSPRSILRRTVLAIGGVTDLRVTYTGVFANRGSSFAEGGDSTDAAYSLFDAVRGQGPSLGYRLGLQRRLPIGERVFNARLQPNDILDDNHRFSASTRLSRRRRSRSPSRGSSAGRRARALRCVRM